jgi:glycosyltransferase involved in cell wall biosynthesis
VKVLCLIDSVVKPGDHWLWDYLPEHGDQVDFVSVTASDRFLKWGKLLAYYPTYCWLALKAVLRMTRTDYDVVVAWEGKNGFPLALVRRVLRIRRPKLVLLAYSQRGLIADYPALARFALQTVDHISVLSEWEAAYYHERLGIAKERLSVEPLGWYDSGAAVAPATLPSHERFIFASGRSFRDYGTFVAALDGIDSKVVINARKFNLAGLTLPDQVVVNDLLPTEQFWTLLAQCRFVVVPLVDVPHAAGDGHIVQAMAAGKAVIATRAPSTLTYVEDGVTGLLVPPHDPNAMRQAIRHLLDHPEDAERMGREARRQYEERYTFEAFAVRVHALLERVAPKAATLANDHQQPSTEKYASGSR